MRGDYTYRAVITRITAEGIWVIVPKLGIGVEYGPCQRLNDIQGVSTGGQTTTGYAQGAQVLVSTVNGIPEDLVVLGTLS